MPGQSWRQSWRQGFWLARASVVKSREPSKFWQPGADVVLHMPQTPGAPRLQAFRRLAGDMVEGRDSEAGPQPPNLVPRQWSLLPPVVIDSTPFGEALDAHVSSRLFDLLMLRGDAGAEHGCKHPGKIGTNCSNRYAFTVSRRQRIWHGVAGCGHGPLGSQSDGHRDVPERLPTQQSRPARLVPDSGAACRRLPHRLGRGEAAAH